MRPTQNRAFTLIEVLVSMVLVVVVSAASWQAISVLSPSAQATNSLTRAQNLLVQSQEELYSSAQNHFDILSTCNFPGNANDPSNNCGFTNTNTTFPDFQRSLNFVPEASTELKEAQIQITSTGTTGVPLSVSSSITLARPPNALPGNVVGLVENQATGAILGGVSLVIQNQNTSDHSTTTSTPTLLTRSDNKQVNYTFADASGRFTLQPGIWQLTATMPGFFPYQSGNIEIDNGQELELQTNINLVPKPADAHINLTFSNATSGTAVYLLAAVSAVNLYQNGGLSPQQFTVSGGSNFSVDIPFTDTNQQCFTITTSNVYKSNLAGNFSCTAGNTLNPNGWSSAVVGQNGAPNCNQNWLGGQGIDRICVNPGDNLNVNIPLTPVPSTTVTGIVTDLTGTPIPRAIITDNWHDGTVWNYTFAQSDSTGTFSISAPAEQELFPSQTPYFSQLHVQASVIGHQCCGQQVVNAVNNTFSVGPLYAGATFNEPLKLNTNSQSVQCGNVQGNVMDAKLGAPLGNSTVQVSFAPSVLTGSTGNFSIQCSDPSLGFAVPTSSSALITASQANYYSYTSSGGPYYAMQSPVVVTANQTSTVPSIGLWPIGYGTISGIVTDAGDGHPLAGVPVNVTIDRLSSLNGYANFPTVVTDAQGNFSISHVQETWPPPSLMGNPSYNQTAMNYNLSIPATGIYAGTVASAYQVLSGPGISEFQVQAGQDTHFNIALVHKSGL